MFELLIPNRRYANAGFFSEESGAWPAVDVYEAKDKYVIEADVPGVDEKDLKIEFTDGQLVLEANRAKQGERKDVQVHVKERLNWSYRRVFALGNDIDAEKIQATYKNGSLTIEIPKSNRVMPRTIPISVSHKH